VKDPGRSLRRGEGDQHLGLAGRRHEYRDALIREELEAALGVRDAECEIVRAGGQRGVEREPPLAELVDLRAAGDRAVVEDLDQSPWLGAAEKRRPSGGLHGDHREARRDETRQRLAGCGRLGRGDERGAGRSGRAGAQRDQRDRPGDRDQNGQNQRYGALCPIHPKHPPARAARLGNGSRQHGVPVS
jgi:hypothetical protein